MTEEQDKTARREIEYEIARLQLERARLDKTRSHLTLALVVSVVLAVLISIAIH